VGAGGRWRALVGASHWLIVLTYALKLKVIMLVQKNAPVGEIKALKAGDVYMGSVIESVNKKGRIISFITKNGDLYSAHLKNKYYNVFRNERHKRKMEKLRGAFIPLDEPPPD
jgi:hypothetical protein